MSEGSLLWKMLEAIETAGPAVALRESWLAYPIVNTLHIIGIALLFGSIVALDLRLIGWRRSAGPSEAIARLLQPVAVAGLVIAFPAGLLLFATDARAYAASPLFQLKLVLIALALANAAWLRKQSGTGLQTGGRTAFAAAASIMLWLGVIVCGRMIGYF